MAGVMANRSRRVQRSNGTTKLFRYPITLIGLFSIVALSKADPTAYVITGSDEFGTIDLATGSASMVGNMGRLLSGLGETSSGALYGGEWQGGGLYKVNTSTGALTLVGSSSISYVLTGSTANGSLYAIGTNQNLYRLNASTGAATFVGATGLSIPSSGPFSSMSGGSGSLF